MEVDKGTATNDEQTKKSANPIEINRGQSIKGASTGRKSSFSETLNKITEKANPFGHRRRTTTAALPSSNSAASFSITQSRQSHLPTPSGISRNNSFLGSVNSLITRNTSENNNPKTSTTTNNNNNDDDRHIRKFSDKFTQLPFNHENRPQESLTTLTPRYNPESSNRIEHRGLMTPIQPLSVPRSSTIGNLAQQHSILTTPSFMRSTSSSTNRRRQNSTSSQRPNPPLARKSPIRQMTRRGSRPANSGTTPPRTLDSQSPLLSTCFPIRKNSQSIQNSLSPPPHSTGPTAKRVTMAHETTRTHQGTLPRSAHVPPATRIPTPAIGLPTPDYEDIDEDARDKRAEYIESKSNIDDLKEEEEEEDLTTTNANGKFQMLSPVKCNRSTVGEALHRRASHLDPNPYRSANDLLATLVKEDVVDLRHHVNDMANPRLVHESQPPTFWLGRHTSLSDRFRTESLPQPPLTPITHPSSSSSSTSSCPNSAAMLDPTRRNRRIFYQLDRMCTTQEARSSLEKFKAQYEARCGIDGEGPKVEKGKKGSAAAAVVKEGKAKGWLDAITGRNRNIS